LANEQVTVIRAVEGSLSITVIGTYIVSNEGTISIPDYRIELLPLLVTLRNKTSLDLLPGITQIDSILPPTSCLCHAITSCPLSKVSPNSLPDSVNPETYTRGSSVTGIVITGVGRLANEQVTVIRAVEGSLSITVIGTYIVSNEGTISIPDYRNHDNQKVIVGVGYFSNALGTVLSNLSGVLNAFSDL
jgi:protein involved in polysaccharide export with SLBB domain